MYTKYIYLIYVFENIPHRKQALYITPFWHSIFTESAFKQNRQKPLAKFLPLVGKAHSYRNCDIVMYLHTPSILGTKLSHVAFGGFVLRPENILMFNQISISNSLKWINHITFKVMLENYMLNNTVYRWTHYSL